jgi:hypothetical protein
MRNVKVIKASLAILILSITLLSMNTVSFASQKSKESTVEDTTKDNKYNGKKQKLIYNSSEGIGIVVDRPVVLNKNDYRNIKGAKRRIML